MSLVYFSTANANSALFTLVTVFMHQDRSNNYIQVQSSEQLTRKECESQVFRLGDNKVANLPFGRTSRLVITGGEAKLKNGEIDVSGWETKKFKFSFLCVPTS